MDVSKLPKLHNPMANLNKYGYANPRVPGNFVCLLFQIILQVVGVVLHLDIIPHSALPAVQHLHQVLTMTALDLPAYLHLLLRPAALMHLHLLNYALSLLHLLFVN